MNETIHRQDRREGHRNACASGMLGVIAVMLILVCISGSDAAETYYISTTGDDGTGDGSYGSPFAGLDYVVSRSDIGDGINESGRDTIIIQGGTYSSGTMMAQVDVIYKDYITIQSNGTVLIESPSSPFFKWQNSTHVTIDGIFVNGSRFGYFFFDDNFIINNSRGEYSSDVGIRFGGDFACTSSAGGHSHSIMNSIFSNNGNAPNGGHTGIEIKNTNTTSWDNRIIIRNCTCNNNGEDGIQTAGAVDNSNADEDHIARYVEIYDCTLNGNGENSYDCKASRYVRFYNNTCLNSNLYGIIIHEPENDPTGTGPYECAFYNNWIEGSEASQIRTSTGDVLTDYTKNIMFNNVIINGDQPGITWAPNANIAGDKAFSNTFYGHSVGTKMCYCGSPATCLSCAGFGITSENSDQITVKNNLVFGNDVAGFHIADDAIKENNYHDGTSVTNNTVITGAKFVNASNKDFHLLSDSPAIDNSSGTIIFTSAEVTSYKLLLGSDLPIDIYGPTIDKDSNPRSNRTCFDIGAYEYMASMPNPTSLTHTNGTSWVNHTWNAGTGNVTDSYNVSVNSSWTNTSSNEYYNNTGLSSSLWSNITVWAYNSTYNELSSGGVSENVQLLVSGFSEDHLKAYYSLTYPTLNTVNLTGYYVWNRTLDGGYLECNFNLEVIT